MMFHVRYATLVVCLIAGLTATKTSFGQASTPTPSTPNDLKITITNEGNSSFTLTPLWFGFQDGTFDLFNPGAAPSAGLEAVAETGNPGMLIGEFTAAGQPGNRQGVVTGPAGIDPIIEPGETGTAYITPFTTSSYQYFSFASMIIPSNDTFIGNADPQAYHVIAPTGEINDPSGVFTIEVLGSQLWDAGTELNDGMGAPFTSIMGSATDTSDGIGPAGNLMEFVGTTNGAGLPINDFIGANEVVATITISQIPEPSTFVLGSFGIMMLGFMRRRKSNR